MYYTADFPIKVRVDNKSTVEEAVKIGNEINNLVVSAVNKSFHIKILESKRTFIIQNWIHQVILMLLHQKLKIIEN